MVGLLNEMPRRPFGLGRNIVSALAWVACGAACGPDPAAPSAAVMVQAPSPATATGLAPTIPSAASPKSAGQGGATAPQSLPPGSSAATPATPAPATPMPSAPPVADPGVAGMNPAMSEPPREACNPADKTPDADIVEDVATGAPPSGPYMVVVEHDPELATHTIYRPKDLTDKKHPIVLWENGGCFRDGLWFFSEFLLELASYGSIVLVDGPPKGTGMGTLGVDGAMMIAGLDWITAENERPCSKFYRNVDVRKVAAMGQSCGGLHAYGAAKDPRVTTVGIWNSGLLERGQQQVYDWLHAPMGFFIGGSGDIAYGNAEADFEAIDGDFPVFYGNLAVGHGGTYAKDNGGEFARVGVAWLQWQLFGDETEKGKGMFVGADCGLCDSEWVIKKKNLE